MNRIKHKILSLEYYSDLDKIIIKHSYQLSNDLNSIVHESNVLKVSFDTKVMTDGGGSTPFEIWREVINIHIYDLDLYFEEDIRYEILELARQEIAETLTVL